MRVLVLLRGSPGIGKSTFIKEHGLENYTICPDEIRLLFQSPQDNPDGTQSISQKNDRDVWGFLFTLLEKRMERGELTVIDAVHSHPDQVNKYKSYCNKWRYRCVVIEFFHSVSVEECIARNNAREELKQVPEKAIRLAYARSQIKLGKWAKVIKPEEWEDYVEDYYSPMDFNKYKAIQFIGDIHGCFHPLNAIMQFGLRYDYLYVFLGDYLDRGIQNKEVLEWILSVYKEPNCQFLEGNHERWLRAWAHDEPILNKEFLTTTAVQIKDVDKSLVREFCRRLQQGFAGFFDIEKEGPLTRLIYATHGGITRPFDIFTPTRDMIFGVGKYEDIEDVYATWNRTYGLVWQVNGHRNIDAALPIYNGRCINLCDVVEFGGNIRTFTFLKEGETYHMADNPIFAKPEDAPLKPEDETEETILERMRKSKYIKKRELPNGVESYNFTREAFYGKMWDAITIRARGLFVKDGKVLARGFNKFFNLEERPESSRAFIQANWELPVRSYGKVNGYLGLVSLDGDDLFIASKTTTLGDHAKWLTEIVDKKGRQKFIDFLTGMKIGNEFGYTLLFEVVTPKDTHIIDYGDEEELYFLGAVVNRIDEFQILEDIEQVKLLVETLGVKTKERRKTIDSTFELMAYIEECLETKEETEGVVLEDSAGRFVKIKFPFYNKWKFWRYLLQWYQKAGYTKGMTSRLTTVDDVLFYTFMTKLGVENVEGKSIIEVRRMMEADNG